VVFACLIRDELPQDMRAAARAKAAALAELPRLLEAQAR